MNLNITNSWENVTVFQYQEMIESYENDNDFEKYIQFLCILTNTDMEYWNDRNIEEIAKYVKTLTFLQKEPESKLIKEINEFKLIDINTIKLGEFIDIEYFLNNNFIKNIHKIAAIMYRKYKYDEFNNIIYEPYKNINLETRGEYFLNQPIINILGVIKYINEFKSIFNENYKTVLNPNINEEDLDPIDELDEKEKKEIEKEKLREKWSWEFLLKELTNDDLTKYNKILDLELIFIFNQLIFKQLFKQ